MLQLELELKAVNPCIFIAFTLNLLSLDPAYRVIIFPGIQLPQMRISLPYQHGEIHFSTFSNEEPRPNREGLHRIQAAPDSSLALTGVGHSAE